MAARESEADRLRRCRLIFERARRDNVEMKVARARIDAEAKRDRLDTIRRNEALIAERGGPRAPSLQPTQQPFWWQKEGM